MKIIIIVAMTRDRVIGRDGAIPWRDPEDMRHFKRTTTGHAVVMGRKTFESIGKPLPDRRNIVITRNPDYVPAALGSPSRVSQSSSRGSQSSIVDRRSSINIVCSLDEALELCRGRNEEKAFIIGGAQTYELALPIADEMIITHIDQDGITGDAHFPAWSADEWLPQSGTVGAFPRATVYRRV
ncbi:MAG: dihydrofolate reductase [Planctomycetota bacterium]